MFSNIFLCKQAHAPSRQTSSSALTVVSTPLLHVIPAPPADRLKVALFEVEIWSWQLISRDPRSLATSMSDVLPRNEEVYAPFRHRLKANGRYVAGLSAVDGFDRGVLVDGVVQPPYELLTFERGVTEDEIFVQWASQSLEGGTRLPPPKDFTLEEYNAADQLLSTYAMYAMYGCLAFGVQIDERARCGGFGGGD